MMRSTRLQLPLRPRSCRAKSCSLRWVRAHSLSNCRAADETLRQLLEPLHDPRTATCIGAERAMLAALDGSCRTPIAGLAEPDGDRLMVEGLLLKPDGSGEIRDHREGAIADAAGAGD